MSDLLQEFEKTKTFKCFYSTLLKFDESLNCYVASEKWRNKEAELLTAAWWMFQEQQAEIDGLEKYQRVNAGCINTLVNEKLEYSNRITIAIAHLASFDHSKAGMNKLVRSIESALEALRGEHE